MLSLGAEKVWMNVGGVQAHDDFSCGKYRKDIQGPNLKSRVKHRE